MRTWWPHITERFTRTVAWIVPQKSLSSSLCLLLEHLSNRKTVLACRSNYGNNCKQLRDRNIKLAFNCPVWPIKGGRAEKIGRNDHKRLKFKLFLLLFTSKSSASFQIFFCKICSNCWRFQQHIIPALININPDFKSSKFMFVFVCKSAFVWTLWFIFRTVSEEHVIAIPPGSS